MAPNPKVVYTLTWRTAQYALLAYTKLFYLTQANWKNLSHGVSLEYISQISLKEDWIGCADESAQGQLYLDGHNSQKYLHQDQADF